MDRPYRGWSCSELFGLQIESGSGLHRSPKPDVSFLSTQTRWSARRSPGVLGTRYSVTARRDGDQIRRCKSRWGVYRCCPWNRHARHAARGSSPGQLVLGHNGPGRFAAPAAVDSWSRDRRIMGPHACRATQTRSPPPRARCRHPTSGLCPSSLMLIGWRPGASGVRWTMVRQPASS